MIIGFRHKGLEAFYRTGSTRGINASHAKKLGIILVMLDAAKGSQELNQPGLRLHSLKGSMKEHWSVWVNGNWRVTFRFTGVDTELVDYQDYH
ncbi:type II toxin-antitoxin system RelE/ParE family toxin [Candidatus Regiella insecticola]|uniref:Toxin protein HIgB of toxin-antitoxin system n=1 Tax=Candidatus Regiella insecticola TaxID=138073 RepID=A0A6L2ZRT3_9ENTR|nr:type II toxin-antitoxin system RelE/ParE family toxin [Candidatus Regiella insecticola]GFN47180.1 toxin protein HIgB of toxin-antitoxin system [Candidatus Regiella insecticola]